MTKKTVFFITALVLWTVMVPSAGVLAAEKPDDVQEVVKKVDRLYRADSSHSRLEMSITTPDWERTLKMEVWTEGMDKTFIRIDYPAKDSGIATLRIGNEMWNYFPKINKVMKVPPSMMMSSWMGSDFTNDDLVKESSLLEDYEASLIRPGDADPSLYYIELIPRQNRAVVWGKIVLVVRRSDYIPVREEYYDEKGTKMRVMEFTGIRDFGDRRIPSVLEIRPLSEKKKGHSTAIIYNEASFNEDLDEEVFSLRNLRSRR